MQAKELIGKIAIRTAPNKRGDWSYTDEPILIVNATDDHIYAKKNDFGDIRELIFNQRFTDDNWELFEKVVPKPWSNEMVGDLCCKYKKNLNFSPFMLAPKYKNECGCECDEEIYGKSIIKELFDDIKELEQSEEETPIYIKGLFKPPLDKVKVTVVVDSNA